MFDSSEESPGAKGLGLFKGPVVKFRKGKVPVAVVKARYGEKLRQDAEGEAIREALKNGLAELNINNKDLIGEPAITKFDKKEDGSEIYLSINGWTEKIHYVFKKK
jgi:hypothetical protein